ncbi:hypothetical protein LX32DRAFT_428960 [Colletotrichum zoysiae]|uniref:Uncharacterized protein n=1 Tax=Colletotrichum zoysiae TaxID=1216348 RepID=A0AAD9M0A0_9PEZI|nr:hypothetical protein LX32DRAFT_428960 [Colletotrichum zoysiae]
MRSVPVVVAAWSSRIAQILHTLSVEQAESGDAWTLTSRRCNPTPRRAEEEDAKDQKEGDSRVLMIPCFLGRGVKLAGFDHTILRSSFHVLLLGGVRVRVVGVREYVAANIRTMTTTNTPHPLASYTCTYAQILSRW